MRSRNVNERPQSTSHSSVFGSRGLFMIIPRFLLWLHYGKWQRCFINQAARWRSRNDYAGSNNNEHNQSRSMERDSEFSRDGKGVRRYLFPLFEIPQAAAGWSGGDHTKLGDGTVTQLKARPKDNDLRARRAQLTSRSRSVLSKIDRARRK